MSQIEHRARLRERNQLGGRSAIITPVTAPGRVSRQPAPAPLIEHNINEGDGRDAELAAMMQEPTAENRLPAPRPTVQQEVLRVLGLADDEYQAEMLALQTNDPELYALVAAEIQSMS